MADQTASIRIRILGGIRAALEADTFADSMDRVGDQTDDVAKAAVAATLALKWLTRQMRRAHGASIGLHFGMLRLTLSLTATSIIAWSLASVVLPALVAALWSAGVAAGTLAVAFIGGMIAIGAAAGLMAVGVIGRFKQMSGVIGSAANELQNAGYSLRGAFRDATAAGADKLMRGLADGLEALVPLVQSLQGAFTEIGDAFGGAFRDLFTELASKGPEIRRMFRELVPAIRAGADMLGALLGYLIQIGTIGAPLVADAFEWLERKLRGWTDTFTGGDIDRAKKTLSDFADGVRHFTDAFLAPIKPVWGDALAAVGKAWGESGDDLGTILGTIVATFMRIGTAVLPTVSKAIQWLAGVLPGVIRWIENAGTTLIETFAPAAPFFTNVLWPVVKWLFGIIRDGLAALLPVIQAVMVAFGWLGTAIGDVGHAASGIWDGFKNAATSVFDWLAGKFEWIKKTLNGLPGAIKGGVRGAVSAVPIIGGPLSTLIPGNAKGGTMTAGGLSWVGERGPELVSLPKASTVFAAAESRRIASHDRPRQQRASAPRSLTIPWTLVMPDMRQLASGVKEVDLADALLEG